MSGTVAAERLLACLDRQPAFDRAAVRPLLFAGRRIGWIPHGFAPELAKIPALFSVGEREVVLADGVGHVADLSSAVNAEVWRMRDLSWFLRWNDEYAGV